MRLNRRGVIPVTAIAGQRLYVQVTGKDRRDEKQERRRTMRRQTRLNLTALLVALPMTLITLTTAISNFP